MNAKYIKYLIKELLLKIENKNIKKERDNFFENQLKNGLYNIPVFIVSFNRLSYLESLVKQLEDFGFNNICIIDNHSSYQPLLDYYNKIEHKVYYMKENLGHMVFWKSDIFKKFRNNFYIVTDPDLEIPEECPQDFIKVFFDTLRKHPYVRKIGFSLKISDLPDSEFSNSVYDWEKQFYTTYIKKYNMYYAEIDTTFALYLPDQFLKRQNFISAYRIGKPYELRHLPWYKTNECVTDEDIFYSSLKTNGWSDPVKGFKATETKKENI